jgi:hypothetical protein
VDYKALKGLSLLWIPHFHARGATSLKDLTRTPRPQVKSNASLLADKIQRNTPTSVKHSSYEELE